MQELFIIGYGIFDLKDATVYLVDGFTATGAVNLSAGYSTGATTMAVDGFVDELETGQRFTIASNTQIYRITGHTENTGGSTVSISFSPPLVASAPNDSPIVVGGRRLEAKLGEGTLTFNIQKERQYRLNRGLIDQVRDGNEVPMDVSFDFNWEYLRGANDIPSIQDVLDQVGPASHWISTDSDQCAPYCVDIYIENRPSCGTQQDTDEDIILPDFRYESLDHDGSEGTVSCSGKCNAVRPIAVRL